MKDSTPIVIGVLVAIALAAGVYLLLENAIPAGQAMPAAGLETFAFSSGTPERPTGLDGLELLSRVDRILYNNENGVGRTTLVKYLRSKR